MGCGLHVGCVAGVLDRCCKEGIEAGGSLDVPDGDRGCIRRRYGHSGDVNKAELCQDQSDDDRHGDGGVGCWM